MNYHGLINNGLIIAIINKKLNSRNYVYQLGMFSPITGKYLNAEKIYKEDKITVINSIENRIVESRVNFQFLKEMTDEGIDIMDIFDISSPFYNDICFQYDSKKDIALKDRVLEYFPNITICDEGCDLIGINMTEITAICECFYSEEKKQNALKDKVLEESQVSVVDEMISSSNIYVVKCINLVVNLKYVKKSHGGFIILSLMIIEIIFTIFYFVKNIYSINKYINSITNKYINYLLKKKPDKTENKPSINNDTKSISLKTTNKNKANPKRKEKKSKRKSKNKKKKIFKEMSI